MRRMLGRRDVLRIGDLVDRMGESEVGDAHPSIATHEQIRRLHIAVHDARCVGGSESFGGLEICRDDGSECEWLGTGALTLEQRAAVDILHHEEDEAVVLADLVHDNDVRVGEPSECPGFAMQPSEIVGIGARAQELHRDRTIEGRIAGAVHLTRSAGSDRAEVAEVWRKPGRDRGWILARLKQARRHAIAECRYGSAGLQETRLMYTLSVSVGLLSLKAQTA